MKEQRGTAVTQEVRAAGMVEALEESEARYRGLFEQSPIGIFTFDRSLRVTDCNLSLARLLRSTPGRVVGTSLRHVDDARAVPSAERVLDGEPLFLEASQCTRPGAPQCDAAIWLTPIRDSLGEVRGGLGLVEDVTPQREAQRALARNEADFRTLIENAPDAIGVYRRDGEHVYVNARLAQYLGYTPEELGRKAVKDLVHPGDHAMFEDRNARRSAGERLAPVEYRLLHRDGRILFAEITSILVHFDGGPAALCMMRDLTERKKLELRLLQSDRLASLGILAAGIAHEINNPLAYVMTNLELLARFALPEIAASAAGQEDRERAMRALEMVEQARSGAERIRRIVRDVKTFGRGDDDEREPVDVATVLDAALEIVGHELRHRARLVRDFAPVPRVLASESRLGQVFLNVLVNAAQALPAEGTAGEVSVRVSASASPAAPPAVVVEISDTGEGIPADLLSRVFDPFFTTKAVGVGTGLGLFVCQGIVTSLGGALEIESELGRGTTVRVRLPAIESPAGPRVSSAASPVARVLLIDDEPSLGRALAAALRGEHDVVAVTSGPAALRLFAEDDRFDLVLCDIAMPGMTGIQLWEAVREAYPALAERFVFVTGGAFTPEARTFLEGDRPYIDKPFDLQQVRALLGRSAPQGGPARTPPRPGVG